MQRDVIAILAEAIWKFRRRTLAALLLLILAKLAVVTVPLALKYVVDGMSRPETVLTVPVAVLIGYALLRFASTLFSEIRDVVFARVTQRTVADFTLRAFNHLHRLGPRFHVLRHTGALVRDIERGTGGIGFLLGVALFTLVPTLVEIGSVLVILITQYSHWFSVIIVAAFLVYSSFTLVFTERRAIYQRSLNELDSTANSRLVDSMLNYETVKTHGNEAYESQRLAGIMHDWIDVGVRNQKALSLLHVGQSSIIAVAVAAVMLLAGQEVVRGAMTVGDLVLINAYVIQICLPLNSLGFLFREAKDAMINAERLFTILNQRPEIEEDDSLPPLKVTGGEVRFEHVDFGYEPSRQILRDINFRIGPGETLAVVGGSGSGKSTLARLLFRFYDPANAAGGRILIDGQDLRSVTQKSLRAAIGIVPQDTILFNDTIAYNIGYARPGASLEEVVEAARAAHVHDFIAALPEQYDTVVGERGMKLSGGEKQRIAIARAILKNPPILVFDEATSALDTRAERAIHKELERLSATRTTLMIAHRLSTVIHADEILVLEHGGIVERGKHRELLEHNGLYAQMWNLQQQQRELERVGRRLAVQPVNLITLLAGVVSGLRPFLDRRQLNLYSVIDAEPMWVTGDPSRLQQVVWDLCANAVDASPPQGRVEFKLERVGPAARITVTDTGTRHSAADTVLQAAQTSAQASAANGLPAHALEAPLDIAAIQAVVEQHHGRLEVEANQEGTVVRIELPLRALARNAENISPPQNGTASGAQLQGMRIAVIDDQPDVREMLSGILEQHGAKVQKHSSGSAALEGLAGLPRVEWPDVLLCDIVLGEEDGYAILNRLRLIEAQRGIPLRERLPAIALTGYTRPESRMRALLAGFQMHLTKPVDPQELIVSIASVVNRHSAATV